MSKGAIVQAIAKAPQLKGRHADFMKKHLTIGISLSITMMVLVKFIVNEPRKKGYAEYYKYVSQITALILFISLFLSLNNNLMKFVSSDIFCLSYRSYDIEAEFNRIRNAGWFQSCGAD